ncbi:MAG: hypothetical protein LBF58_12565 [Deltaproteobacteria bacterium]|jgi:hypothetical protein|nr:hypothetical protein [Deltaproteobacteria bacterium]
MPDPWLSASMAFRDWSHKTIPREHGGYAPTDCRAYSPPRPNDLRGDNARLGALGTVTLSPEGMIIHDDMPFAHAYGSREVTIEKAALPRMGARPDPWD